jgi:RNA polymerase sigma-70 factor (ECF subfamily)
MIYQAAIDESFPVAEPPTQVARLRSGDPAAVAEAVGQYQQRLYRYFVRLVHDQASADDLFQQTWLHVVRHLHHYDSARSFDTWLFAIAHNAAMDCSAGALGESGRSRICASRACAGCPERSSGGGGPPSWPRQWRRCPRCIVRL